MFVVFSCGSKEDLYRQPSSSIPSTEMSEVSEDKPRTPEQNNFKTEYRTKIMLKSILTISF